METSAHITCTLHAVCHVASSLFVESRIIQKKQFDIDQRKKKSVILQMFKENRGRKMLERRMILFHFSAENILRYILVHLQSSRWAFWKRHNGISAKGLIRDYLAIEQTAAQQGSVAAKSLWPQFSSEYAIQLIQSFITLVFFVQFFFFHACDRSNQYM